MVVESMQDRMLARSSEEDTSCRRWVPACRQCSLLGALSKRTRRGLRALVWFNVNFTLLHADAV
jgi:hypothetical protein